VSAVGSVVASPQLTGGIAGMTINFSALDPSIQFSALDPTIIFGD
jgi:hypothetical protein